MNKKTLRKLTLSGVTLGVAALSLTSTTYAWFTTNGSATASGVSGTVTAAGADMLIKSPTGWDGSTPKYDGSVVWGTDTFTTVSEDKVAATFATTTNLINEAGNKDTTLASLKPVSILGTNPSASKEVPDGQFYQLKAGTNTYESSAVSSSCYLHYQVVIALSSLVKGNTYSVTMQLPTLSDVEGEQYLLVDAGTADAHKAGKTLKVKIEDALSLGIKNTVVSGTSNDETTYGSTKGTITSFTGNTVDNSSGFYHAVEENTDNGDAITYYNNVYGLSSDKAISLPSNYEGCYKTTGDNLYFSNWNSSNTKTTNTKTLYTVKGEDNGSFVCVTDLYFFIDGWDYQCFNAIGGLSLFGADAADIKFELVTTPTQQG